MENMNIGSNNINKKRNISHAAAAVDNKDDDDDDEEKKIDTFFALINRIREARDLLINNYGSAGAGEELQETKNYYLHNKQRKKKQLVLNYQEQHHLMPTPMEAWKPLFQPEDFMDEQLLHFNVPPTTFASSPSPNVPDHKDESVCVEEGLDLRLSL